METLKIKSKQVLEYLYQITIESGISEIPTSIYSYGKMGVILWQLGHHLYDLMLNASQRDRIAILNEIQQITPQEIENLSIDISNHPNVIYPMILSQEERKLMINKICQTLKNMPNQQLYSQNILQTINQSLFDGQNILSIQNVNISLVRGIGRAIVKSLLNGKALEFVIRRNDKQNTQESMPKIEYPTINGFEIKGLLGKGGFAKVYLANENLAKDQWRTCALKVGYLESEERFNQEIQNMQLVDHPHVLSFWRTGCFQEKDILRYWISMPNMGGLTLEHLILENVLDLETKLLILMQIADGLAALHQKKIVHRDLKPSNCLISSDFQIKISDFGLSKDLNLNENIDSKQMINTVHAPVYMSPESIEVNIGYYSDVWAFGLIAFELFTGNLPWDRNLKPSILIHNILNQDIDVQQSLNALKISPKLIQVIDQCLKRDASQRYQNAIVLKNVFYDIANKQRNQIKYNQFKQSWLFLLEKNIIEEFIFDEVKSDNSPLKIDAFLSKSEVATLDLDTERLSEILRIFSQETLEMQLADLLKKQVSDQQLEKILLKLTKDREIQFEKIDQEITEALQKLPHSEITRMLTTFSEESLRKKTAVETLYQEKKQHEISEKETLEKMLQQKKDMIRDRLRQEIIEDVNIDQIHQSPEKAKNHIFWSGNIIVFVFWYLLSIGGLNVFLALILALVLSLITFMIISTFNR